MVIPAAGRADIMPSARFPKRSNLYKIWPVRLSIETSVAHHTVHFYNIPFGQTTF